MYFPMSELSLEEIGGFTIADVSATSAEGIVKEFGLGDVSQPYQF